MRSTPDNKGSATILIMLMAGVIITVGLGFNWLVKEHIKSSEGLKNKAEAILKARSAYDNLIYLLLNGKLSRREITLLGMQDLTLLKSIPLNGAEVLLADGVYVRIQDSNGLLSLSNIDRVQLEGLIRRVGKVENTAIPLESLLDWIDPDDLVRLNGAEASYYKSQSLPYAPRNYAVQYKEELSLMRGIGKELYKTLSPFLTILPTTGFNPNTASNEVLRAVLDIDDEALVKMKDYLSQSTLSSDTALFLLTGRRLRTWGEAENYFASRYMEVAVRVGSPRSIYAIKAGLNLVATPNSPYSVFYWQEE